MGEPLPTGSVQAGIVFWPFQLVEQRETATTDPIDPVADGGVFILLTGLRLGMADTTSASEELSREGVAAELESIASDLGEGDSEIDVAVGNKSVTLDPEETIEYDIEVSEHEPMLGDKRESISIELDWQTDE